MRFGLEIRWNEGHRALQNSRSPDMAYKIKWEEKKEVTQVNKGYTAGG